jgi:hypothetical protein
MDINWTVLTYFVIGLFALNGFFKGWWREAIMTAFLALLVFFLQQPGVAQWVIDKLNDLLAAIWGLLPDSWLPTLEGLLENVLGINVAGAGIQADSSDPATWLIILIVFIMVAIFLSRASLSDANARPTPIGGLLGGLVGGLNGFIIISLVREYLDGRALPGGTTSTLPTEITMAGESSAGIASSGISIQAVELPRFTILDSFIPWIIIIFGLIILVAVLNTRFTRDGANVRANKTPYGYKGKG